MLVLKRIRVRITKTCKIMALISKRQVYKILQVKNTKLYNGSLEGVWWKLICGMIFGNFRVITNYNNITGRKNCSIEQISDYYM